MPRLPTPDTATKDRAVSADALQPLISLFILAMGCAVVLTHASQMAGLDFFTYTRLMALALAAIFALGGWRWAGAGGAARRPSGWHGSAWVMLAACVLGAGLALLVNRPNIDDFYYAPNAVFFVEHPAARMGNEIHFLFSGQAAFTSTFWGTANAFELIQAALASLLGLHFLDVYHGIAPAINGALIPAAAYLALRSFRLGKTPAALGALITILFMLVCNEGRTIGEYAFTRIFQGKSVALSVVIPLVIAWSREFFEAPALGRWLRLCALFAAAAGLSISAVPVAACLAVCLLAGWVAERKTFSLALAAGYGLALCYAAACAVFAALTSEGLLAQGSPVNWGWPITFGGHVALAENLAAPVSAALGAVSLAVFGILASGAQRRFVFGWMAAALVLFLNPISAGPLIQYVTSPNAYWRLFFILPFPLVLGLGAALLVRRGQAHSRARAGAIAAGLCLVPALMLAALPASSVFQKPNLRVGWYGYKIHGWLMPAAQAVIADSPPGVMLAPSDVGGAMAMLSSKFSQVRIREDAVRLWLGQQNRAPEAETRIAASEFVDDKGVDFESFQKIITQYRAVNLVLARSSVSARAEVAGFLRSAGFSARTEQAGYILWVRAGE